MERKGHRQTSLLFLPLLKPILKFFLQLILKLFSY